MKVFYSYDATTKLYLEDIHVEAEPIKPQADGSMPKSTAPVYVQPKNSTDIQPVGFHTPKWNGTKWIEGNPKAKAALEKEHADEAKKKAEHEKDREDMIKDSDTSTKGLIKRIERLERIVERLSYVPPVAEPRP